jgi:hypothetical protein
MTAPLWHECRKPDIVWGLHPVAERPSEARSLDDTLVSRKAEAP